MSVTLKLRKCTSEEIRLTKSFVLADDITLTGTFKENIDVLNPVVMVQTDTNLSAYNYVEITELGRGYFMRPEIVNNKLWKLHCHVDVLTTYATGIKGSKALVNRTAKADKINYYVNDGALYTEQREIITYEVFKKNGEPAKLGTDSYYLIVAGG